MLSKFSNVQGFVFDIDGVLTDGQIYVVDGQPPLRSMNIKDGYALQLAIKKEYPIVIISGGNSEASKIRLEKLGIEEVFISVKNKVALLEGLAHINKWNLEHFLYMGDDIPDINAMSQCGIKTCPQDAVEEIKAISDYISPFKGGKGCVRDVIEKVLKLNDDWNEDFK